MFFKLLLIGNFSQEEWEFLKGDNCEGDITPLLQIQTQRKDKGKELESSSIETPLTTSLVSKPTPHILEYETQSQGQRHQVFQEQKGKIRFETYIVRIEDINQGFMFRLMEQVNFISFLLPEDEEEFMRIWKIMYGIDPALKPEIFLLLEEKQKTEAWLSGCQYTLPAKTFICRKEKGFFEKLARKTIQQQKEKEREREGGMFYFH